MKRLLSWIAIVLGVAIEIVLVIDLATHRAPWNVLGVVAAVGLALAAFIFWVMVLADCLMNETREGNERLVWALVIVFTSVVGAGLYYGLRRPKRVAELTA
ncbi:MAG: PLDc N-terminal domain-containing protein [Dehalococcoidia bacterium]|nr:PLDc N-terminal domain-containing protein [Dehalococcoidia bacterium]